MKRKIVALLLVAIALAICCTACGTATDPDPKEEKKPATGGSASGTVAERIDYDLTKMSGTMVYSQVLNFVNAPEKYVGKTVRARGEFRVGYSSKTGLYYPAVMIADATACCSQGLEFVLRGAPEYPTGYPEIGEEITVTGTFDTYYEDTELWCHLVRASLG